MTFFIISDIIEEKGVKIVSKNNFYDGTKLLSMPDIDGQKPEIILCTTNRSAGKTTWFNRYLVKKFIDKKEKFMLMYRFKYEIDDCADKFFKDIKGLYFPEYDLIAKSRNGIYKDLILNDVHCGYAVSLNSADNIKKYSHLFSDTTRILFDEFQSETNNYLPDEISKFISVHTSIARGQGAQSRYVPVYMLSNNVNILNPYFVELGISERLEPNTKFLKGKGYVLEQGFNENAQDAQKNSRFMVAFSGNKYAYYSSSSSYLYSDTAFIEKVKGISKYLCTVRYDGTNYAIREYQSENGSCLFCDNSVDESFRLKIAVNASDMIPSFQMRLSNDLTINVLRKYFNNGWFKFKNQQCKAAIINLLKY